MLDDPQKAEDHDRQEKIGDKGVFPEKRKRNERFDRGFGLRLRLFVGVQDAAKHPAEHKEAHMREERLEVLDDLQPALIVHEEREEEVPSGQAVVLPGVPARKQGALRQPVSQQDYRGVR